MNEIGNFIPSVYIFENHTIGCVKVGITSDKIINRLNDLNDIWSGRKIICQICGMRLVNVKGLLPLHVISGIECPGSNSLPIDKSIVLAESYINKLLNEVKVLSGSEKNSVVRRINNLKKRVSLFKDATNLFGIWKFSVAYYTKNAESIESMAHKILFEYKDTKAPIGEIFTCDVPTACNAVEVALSKLGLLNDMIKKQFYEIDIYH